MKASSKQNHFDVITSKVRRNRDYCVGQVFLSVVYMPTMNYSCLYLAELRSIQNRCNFATICARKGYQRSILYTERCIFMQRNRPLDLFYLFYLLTKGYTQT